MDGQTLWTYIDHTLLRADAVWTEIRRLCEEARDNRAASVCIPPAFVAPAREGFPGLRVGTVIGFPLGYNSSPVKVAEARDALSAGADELDMVINLGLVKAGDFDGVTREIAAIREVSAGKTLKVIVETCYLTEEEKVRLCGCVGQAGADYIKTSTGFGSAGAKLADIGLFAAHLAPGIKIKAAGGISTREDLEAFIQAGCSRLGTSRGKQILG
jgi:deoxyribose-phosphate aldolase